MENTTINYNELLPFDKKRLENESYDFQMGYLVTRIHTIKQEMEDCSQVDDYVADLNKEVNNLEKVLKQVCKAERESRYIDFQAEENYIAEKDWDAKEVENEY